ncbi:MAG: DUF2207 domain-containing protein [Saprospiraceae bacterium]|nr:DUF2207 domain-containing protein [Saprospiraceae bacterium]
MKNLFLITILFVLSLSTRAQDFTVKSFHASISLFKEGYITVNEKITVDFPTQKRGIIRDIPYVFRLNGKKYKTAISAINVSVHPFKVSKNNGNKSIRIGDPDVYLTGQQVYDITYKVEGPFLSSPEYSEFYWNVTGNAWTAPIEKVSFEVLMPDDLAVRYNDLRVFTGQQGATDKNASIAQNGRIISGETSSILQPGQGLTIAIKLPLDYVQKSSTLSLDPEMNQAIPINNQWPWAAIPAGILAFFCWPGKNLGATMTTTKWYHSPIRRWT